MEIKIPASYRFSFWIMWLNYAGLAFLHNPHYLVVIHILFMGVLLSLIEIQIRMRVKDG